MRDRQVKKDEPTRRSEAREELPEGLAGTIAIVGMAGRFPGARDLEEFWENLREGRDAVHFYTDDELRAEGVSEEELADPQYVKASSFLPEYDRFDASFFGFSPREAEVLDPQQRQLLELAWSALEDAGYDPRNLSRSTGGGAEGLTGVFAGATTSSYLIYHLLPNEALRRSVDPLSMLVANAGDSVATRISYKLNLRGPAYTVASACSTSLVAVHNACQSLLGEECDTALAGGASVNLSQRLGYRHTPDSILSPDGRCRTFDAGARGSIFGSGAGILVLKRAEDAWRDGDNIRALILGSAVNNDGSLKVGYTAPSVEGQAAVISEALAVSGVEAEDIEYIEAHGTGTRLGDPIEIQALTRAYSAETDKRQFAAIGSVKTNLGHLDVAAGSAGLIKTVLSLQNEAIPPSLHYEEPNPAIDFAASPVYVNAELADWKRRPDSPRRAGVSSFGLGGTNGHIILQEAPERAPSRQPHRSWQIVPLSARTEGAVERGRERLAEFLAQHGDLPLADVAYTLQVGRHPFPHRRVVVAESTGEAASLLAGENPLRLLSGRDTGEQRGLAFLFPGTGDHYVGMAHGLYRTEAAFREELDRCAELLKSGLLKHGLGTDLREVLYPEGIADWLTEQAKSAKGGAGGGKPDMRAMLRRGGSGEASEPPASVKAAQEALASSTSLTHAAIFSVEYALARLWRSWGVEPSVLMGYSTGEYVAACLAGVMSLEDALSLVVERARLIETTEAGSMLAVSLPENEVTPRLAGRDRLSVAALNGPNLTVVAGPTEAVESFEKDLAEAGVVTQRVAAGHAFHTPLLAPVSEALAERARKASLSPPEIPVISNVTGKRLTDEEAVDPEHWVRHMVGAVRFAPGMEALGAEEPPPLLLEVGPGQGLSTLARQSAPRAGFVEVPGTPTTVPSSSPVEVPGTPTWTAFASLRNHYDAQDDVALAQTTLARLWLAGVEVDWAALHGGENGGADRRRVSLPTYAFARDRYWIEAPRRRSDPADEGAAGSEGEGGSSAAESSIGGPTPGLPPLEAAAVPRGESPRFHARPELEVAFRAPSGPIEEGLAEIWREILGVEPIGTYDNFFDLGGHSLLGTQLLSRIQDAFTVDLTLQDLFNSPTVGEMAPLLDPGRVEAPASSTVPATPPLVPTPLRAEGGPYPLSFSQERMWFLSQFDQRTAAFNIPAAVRLTGDLDAEALAWSLQQLVDRHESLRSRFPRVADRAMQEVLPAGSVSAPLPVVDLSGLPDPARRELEEELVHRRSSHAFHLVTGPVIVNLLLRLAPDENRLVMVVHHIVSDGWSNRVLQRELALLYQSRVTGAPVRLPKLDVHYVDFAHWQRELLTGETLERHVGAWRERLAGVPFLDLPTDRPRQPVQTFEGTNEFFQLPSGLEEKVRDLAQAEDASPFMVLEAAYETLLARLSGQDDFAVGTFIANRNRREVEGLVGFFVNNLPLRADLSGRPTFRQLLGRVRETTLAAYAHQDLPYEKLLTELNPPRDMSRPAVFQVMLVLLNFPKVREDLPGLKLETANVVHDRANLDLTLWVTESSGAWEGWLEYNTDLFDPDTARRWIAAWLSILEAGVEAPDTRVDRLPMLGAAERRQLIGEVGTRAGSYDYDQLTHRLFEARAAERPDAEAIVAPAAGSAPGDTSTWKRLTYRQLDEASNRLARHLRSLGVGPDDRVGIALGKRPELAAAVLGTWKAGAAYLPMDPDYGAERLGYMASDAGLAVLLTSEEAGISLPELGCPVLRLEAMEESLAARSAAPLTAEEVGVHPSNLAFVIYTSGTTGRPKGVMIEHRSLVDAYRAWVEEFGLEPDTDTAEPPQTHVNLASFSFDVFSGDFVRALLTGHRLVLCGREQILDPSALYAVLEAERATHLEMVPAVCRTLVGHLKAAGQRLDFLRHVAVGADAWYGADARELLELLSPEARVFDTYGLTEATVDNTITDIRKLELGQGHFAKATTVLPIGRPQVNNEAHVLDGELAPQPAGVPGELFIGGPGLARGYLARPGLTAERFLPHPWTEESPLAEAGARLYRTGDRARWLPNGMLELLGRMDFQVKIRGLRIEPGEIESLLMSHPAVAQAAVMAADASPGDRRLVAYVELEAGGGALLTGEEGEEGGEEKALKAYLGEHLPAPVVPSLFVFLDQLPLTRNGKIDRRALPEPDWSAGGAAHHYEPPEGPLEEGLAEIWEDLLGVEQVGALDNFFERGGHSLLAAQLTSRVLQEWDVELPLPTVFASPVLAEMAIAVEELLIEKVQAMEEDELYFDDEEEDEEEEE